MNENCLSLANYGQLRGSRKEKECGREERWKKNAKVEERQKEL